MAELNISNTCTTVLDYSKLKNLYRPKRKINKGMIDRLKDFLILRKRNATDCQFSKDCNTVCLQNCTISTNCETCALVARQLFVNNRDNDSTTNRVALIAGLVVSGLVVLAAAFIILIVVYRKRRKLGPKDKEEEIQITPSFMFTRPSLSSLSSSRFIQESQIPMDYNHPDSPFIIGAHALQIPHLDRPESPIFASDVVRRSLNLQPTAAAITVNSNINRSSSVRLTKYDYNYPQMIPKPIKKNNTTNSHSSSFTCVGSTHSDKILSTKPVTDEESKKPFEQTLSIHSNRSGSINFYFCPSTSHSQLSIQSNSTMGDGEITVIYDPS